MVGLSGMSCEHSHSRATSTGHGHLKRCALAAKKLRALFEVAPTLPSVGAMARSSSPRRYESGSRRWVPRPPTSCRVASGKTATVRALIRSSVTNCLTAKSSTHSRRRRSSSKTRGSITTPCGPTRRWATNHRHPRQLSGLHKMGQRQRRRWPAGRVCTNIPKTITPRGQATLRCP